MKEIKAYVRERMAGAVVEALVSAGFIDFAVLTVRGVAEGLAPETYEYSYELGDAYELMTKIELICHDERVRPAVDLIRQAARTGQPGDGIVFIAAIDDAVRIYDGRTGEAALDRR
ncbi:MAG TPA: P-II family nitrogen regulator [Kofleriaceae bacterium]|nr:P-II family nitrogen regulator [Kofleriaceae bacterium]